MNFSAQQQPNSNPNQLFNNQSSNSQPNSVNNPSNQSNPQNQPPPPSNNPSQSNQNNNTQINQSPTSQQQVNRVLNSGEPDRIWFSSIENQIRNSKNIQGTNLNCKLSQIAFSMGLSFFEPRQTQRQKYTSLHINRPNFGWSNAVLGEIDIRVCTRETNTINKIWDTVVTFLSNVLNINEILVCQYLEVVLIYEKFYTTELFTKNFLNGQYLWSLNNQAITSLLVDEKTVNESSHLFSVLLEGVYRKYAAEITSMIGIINFLMEGREASFNRFYKEFVMKGSADIVHDLWVKFTYLCCICGETAGERKEVQENLKKKKQMYMYLRNKNIEVMIRNHEHKMMMMVLRLMTAIVGRDTHLFKQPKRTKLINIMQALKFFTSEYTHFLNIQSNSAIYDQALKQALHFLLKFFPFAYFHNETAKEKQIQKRSTEQIRAFLQKNQSILFSPFRLLFQAHRNEGKLEQAWEEIPQEIYWLMRDEVGWAEWLAILFQEVKPNSINKSEDVLFHLVRMVKKVVSQDHEAFWSQKNPAYQFASLKQFIENTMKSDVREFILPVLTKSIKKQVTEMQLEFMGFDFISQIFGLISQNLTTSNKSPTGFSSLYSRRINNNYQDASQTDKHYRNSFSTHLDRYPEQQLKFFCKLIIHSQQNIPLLENKIFFEGIDESGTGILISSLLFDWLYKIKEYNISALKCIRYILKAIDTLFNNSDTRKCLLIGLSLSTFVLESQNYLEDMIGLACMRESFSEEYRQSQKLRKVISDHLCNLITQSVYLSQYFPLQSNPRLEQAYLQAHSYLSNSRFQLLKDWFLNNLQISPFKTDFWFYNLLLIFQSDQLLPRDFESIRLLILKMKVQTKKWKNQRQSVIFVQKILDKANIFKQITDNLEPILNTQISTNKAKALSPYKFQNLRYIASIDSISKVRFRAKIEESSRKRRQKIVSAEAEVERNVLGNISGSLELIAILLKISFQENVYRNICELQVYKQVIKSFCETQHLFHFSLQINRSERQSGTSTHYSSIGNSPLDLKHTYEINILQVVANLINFQEFHQIQKKQHANKSSNFLPHLKISEQLFENQQQFLSIFFQTDLIQNIMGLDHNPLFAFDADYSIGTHGVLTILGLLLLKGKGTLLYNCLINHDCKILQQIGEQSLIGCKDEFRQFLKQVMQKSLNPRAKNLTEIFQFLTIAISTSMFFAQEIIINFLKELSPTIRIIIYSINKPTQLYLLNKIGLFILAINYYQHYYKDEISTFMKYPDNIVGEIVDKIFMMKMMDSVLPREYNYKHLLLSLKLQHKLGLQILYKGTIGIFIELTKMYLMQESPQISEKIFDKLIIVGSEILSTVPPITHQEIQEYDISPRNYFGLEDYSEVTLFSFTLHPSTQIFDGLAFIKPFLPFLTLTTCCYGRTFQFQPSKLLSQYLRKENSLIGEQNICEFMNKIYAINLVESMNYCTQIVSSGFLTLVSGVVGVGDLGFMMENSLEDGEMDRMRENNKINKNRMNRLGFEFLDNFKFRNMHITHSQIFGKSSYNKVGTLINLSRTLIDYLQNNSHWQHNNDYILIIQSQILKMIVSIFHKQHSFSKQHSYQFAKLLNYLLDSTNHKFSISPKVYLLFLHACALSYHTNAIIYNPDRLLKICIKVQHLMIPETFKNKNSLQAQLAVQENVAMDSIFMATSVLSQVICPSYSQIVLDDSNLNRIQSLQIITLICTNFICKRLKGIHTLQLNLMGILNLMNSLLEKTVTIIISQHEKNFLRELILEFYSVYPKYILSIAQQNTQLQTTQDSQLFVLLTETFRILHLTYQMFDINSSQSIFSYLKMLIKVERISEATEKKKKEKEVTVHRLGYLLDSYSNSRGSHLDLLELLELKEYLGFVHEIAVKKEYWTNLAYRNIMESLFVCIFNQNQLFHLLENQSSSGKKKGAFKIIPITSIERLLHRIQTQHFKNIPPQQTKHRLDVQPSLKTNSTSINLLDFTARLQILTLLYYYTRTLASGLQYSNNLKNFCSKILGDFPQINQTIWQKICNTLDLIMDFVLYNFLEPIKFNSEEIVNCLILYKIAINNTDLAYETDFLTAHFQRLYEPPSSTQNQLLEGLQITLMGFGVSLLKAGRNLVEIWKQNDWKDSISWYQTRSSFIKRMLDWQKYLKRILASGICSPQMTEDLDRLQEWLIREIAVSKQNLY